MELNDVMRTTFAARDYTGEDLPDNLIYDLIENARFAPSGGNRQGNRVIVVRSQETRNALSRLAEPAAKRYVAQIKAGESPWNAVTPTSVTSEEIEATPAAPPLINSFKEASGVLVFVVDLRVVASMDQDLDRIGVISGASIYPFVWNVLLGARQSGFGGTITTLAAARESDVQTLLNIPKEFAVAAVVPLGKPVKQFTKLKRNSVEEIASVEYFDGKPLIKVS